MKFVLSIIFILSMFNLYGSNYEYRKAQLEDVPCLLHLMKTYAAKERTKIVVLPKRFRQASLEEAIKKGRLFIALEKNKEEDHKHPGFAGKDSSATTAARIVAYKKLFVIKDDTEKQAILSEELRCTDPKNCSFAGIFTHDGTCKQTSEKAKEDMFSCCIYNGADFTHPEHRNKGLNQRLTACALAAIQDDIKSIKAPYVTLAYGMVKENAGKTPGDKTDRTISLAKSFATFLSPLYKSKDLEFHHFRYPAFMPTFDQDSQELRPLPDEKAVAGYGCILAYKCKE